jgi:PIN domain nuclease of toxin-antitoxin system
MSETRYLIDTHVLLWALSDDARLPERHRNLLLSDAQILVSAA